MKILLVSSCFYPANSPRSFRTTELAKQLVRTGHEVVMYIPESDYCYEEFIKSFPMTIKRYRTVAVSQSASLFNRIKGRLLAQFLEYPDITDLKYLSRALRCEEGYELLISIAMPHSIHWTIGNLYAKGKKLAKTWVADCGDPYMLCGTRTYNHPFYFKTLEKRWCRQCSFIAVPTREAVNGYYPEFRDKIRVIPQAFNFDEVVLNEYTPNRVPTFAFSGNIIPKVRDPRPLLDYLAEKQADFKLIFYSTKHHLLQPYKDRLGDRLEIYNYIPRLELLRRLSSMDFLLNIENTTTVQTPSKLIDYALTRRPILSVDTQKLDCENVDRFLAGDYSGQYRVENIEQYNIANVANQFLDLCKQ